MNHMKKEVKWAKRFKIKKGNGMISGYEVKEEKLRKNFSAKEFMEYSDEWLDRKDSCHRKTTL